MPLLKEARYDIKTIYIARKIADVPIHIIFPDTWQKSKDTPYTLDFTLRMNLDPQKNRWYIINFGNLLSFNILKGDYNPGHFYLSEPTKP